MPYTCSTFSSVLVANVRAISDAEVDGVYIKSYQDKHLPRKETSISRDV